MDPSVRAGRAFYDSSVRAGRVYTFEPSVRAGRAFYERSGAAKWTEEIGSAPGNWGTDPAPATLLVLSCCCC